MGLFGKLFDKKICAVCGGEIGLLGNRKLEDGNLCKECASRLSPWFSERRHSTVAEIEEQLKYREENKSAVASFHTTLSYGDSTKILIDEDARKFMITSARNLAEANPDVIDFSQVTGARLDIEENKRELTREDENGKSVSYNPPRYEMSYHFFIIINVNHPYFDEMKFRLNRSAVEVTPPAGQGLFGKALSDPSAYARNTVDFQEYEKMGKEITAILTTGRQKIRDEAAEASAPKIAVRCPVCAATTVPDANGCCEFCGTKL